MAKSSKDRAATLIENIRNTRKSRNYSQEMMAERLGVSQNAYSKIELGHTRLTLVRVFEVAEILKVEVSALISESKE